MFEIDKNQNIKLTRGDSAYSVVGMVAKKSKVPYVPQSGDVIRFALKKDYEDETVLIRKVIPNDTLLLHIEPSDTEDLPFGDYVYDIEITKANGDVDTFIDRKIFKITEEVD